MGQELGIGPLQALNGIDCIQGRPTVSPQLMLALIKRDCPASVVIMTEKDGVYSCKMSRSSSPSDLEQSFTATWDIARASKLGLAHKDNYIKQASVMLMWRAVGEAARKIFPDIIKGLYFPDEMITNYDVHKTDENGDLIESNNDLISLDDLRALSANMRQLDFSADKVRSICDQEFGIVDPKLLKKNQLVKLNEILNKGSAET